MPRKRVSKSPVEKGWEDDDDFSFDDCQSGSGRGSQEPQHRNAANARERARMRVLSKAFCRLKTTLPWVPADTKLSKLDTLRLAASYIAHLRALLHEPRSAHTPRPINLAWPFAFQHGGSLSCSISQRWSVTQPDNRTNQPPENVQNMNCDYRQEYNEDYDDKMYEGSPNEPNCNPAPYSNNYGYKNNYYEMRSYSDNLVNNS
ncbi:basic helix-loop-helix transcription factor scleraxis [Cydia amplana]|uniref:basic helix-loop-helix transcription factor scleraxis n=1 Tax=Cydia amplana TaxID=1869771 RepID=UPI002FE5CCC7